MKGVMYLVESKRRESHLSPRNHFGDSSNGGARGESGKTDHWSRSSKGEQGGLRGWHHRHPHPIISGWGWCFKTLQFRN